ncbi:MAG: glycerate dehydrogenase [Gammaproteobacteria bacterium RIFOXYA12_FULL_61_12]|nr:MAG: glycerate dehydrogenase [Gammaproteobacteria bacterium RIFOXYD12_FULL_61_37]OGT92680.1 MAG: glycerate dehydrogenase [Gammaproteobacteria bacterium RIFOXYA12_FULL_61_12]
MPDSIPASLLDFSTIGHDGDVSLAPLQELLPRLKVHEQTHPHELAARAGSDRILITNKVVIDRDFIETAPALELICAAATGTNNIDLEAAEEHGIAVCNVTGYATASVVQHVFALITALQTRLLDYSTAVRAGAWQDAGQFCLLDYPIRELAGRKLGIIGYGELGKEVGKVAKAFGMELLIAQRPGGASQPGRVPTDVLLQQADIISLHCPLADNTRNLIDTRALALMKPDAILINTARGGIVDEAALAEALRHGRIGGAGIDVLSQEPPSGNPLLDSLPNLLITPHIAWASRESRQRLVEEVRLNISAFLKGDRRNRVL